MTKTYSHQYHDSMYNVCSTPKIENGNQAISMVKVLDVMNNRHYIHSYKAGAVTCTFIGGGGGGGVVLVFIYGGDLPDEYLVG